MAPATARLRPNGLTDLTAASVQKKMKAKGFARNVKRADIERGAADFGVGLAEHIQFVIDAMRRSAEAIGLFVEGEVTLGSPAGDAKALLQNWGLRKDIVGRPPFLQRRLHLWFEIKPPAVDVEDPWSEPPPFDPFTFTLPTRVGPVAPARWGRGCGSAGASPSRETAPPSGDGNRAPRSTEAVLLARQLFVLLQLNSARCHHVANEILGDHRR